MKRILKWVASLALTVAVAGTTFLPAMTANAAEAEGTERYTQHLVIWQSSSIRDITTVIQV